MAGSETWRFADTYPCLFDRMATTPFDAHYFYQNVWAFKAIKRSETPYHVDVGSQVSFVGLLTAITHVIFVDIRPLVVNVSNFDSVAGDILNLPFDSGSVRSLSCLNVAEHIGLGRYGDRLDPAGTKKAARELGRVLARGGDLYFAVPVGRPRVCFNAHRIHSPQQILEYFHGLDLVEFSAVGDDGAFIHEVEPTGFENATYSCGLFHFRKDL